MQATLLKGGIPDTQRNTAVEHPELAKKKMAKRHVQHGRSLKQSAIEGPEQDEQAFGTREKRPGLSQHLLKHVPPCLHVVFEMQCLCLGAVPWLRNGPQVQPLQKLLVRDF